MTRFEVKLSLAYIGAMLARLRLQWGIVCK